MEEMTRRDYFAAAALSGLLGDPDNEIRSPEEMAESALFWADAMLKQSQIEKRKEDQKSLAEVALEIVKEFGRGLEAIDIHDILKTRLSRLPPEYASVQLVEDACNELLQDGLLVLVSGKYHARRDQDPHVNKYRE